MVMPNLRVAIAQINPTVGKLEANSELIIGAIKKAASQDADLVVFGELAVSGYPIADLALNRSFIQDCQEIVDGLIVKSKEFPKLTIVVGHPRMAEIGNEWAIAHNSASVFQNGVLLGSYDKQHLPNYTVFDEERIFVSGSKSLDLEISGVKCSVLICEDLWRKQGASSELMTGNTELTLVLNGSPYERSKNELRRKIATDVAIEQSSALVYANLVGGQDDLIFDGDSFIISAQGEQITQLEIFQEEVKTVSLEAGTSAVEMMSQNWRDWNALVLGLRDYVTKLGIPGVILGLSGGIDSAVCATIAVDALGSKKVQGYALPSQFSSDHSLTDANQLAKNLGIEITTLPISSLHEAASQAIELGALANENIQARLRAILLMAVSNNTGKLLLSTGNKSEIAVGYSTIYGDSAGGYVPLKDVYKTEVYELAKFRNGLSESALETALIPSNSISKPPSAELRADQTDQDSLPDYEVLDAMLRVLIENHGSLADLITAGFDPEQSLDIAKKFQAAEWKRSQAAIGPRISSVSFGRGRRLPIVNGYL